MATTGTAPIPIFTPPSGLQVGDFARATLAQASAAIVTYAKSGGGPLPPAPAPAPTPVATQNPQGPSTVTGKSVAIAEIAARPISGGANGGTSGGPSGGTDTGPFELASDVINYGSNTSSNILVNCRLPTGSVRDGDALVYLEPGSNGWCKFIQWYNATDPTDGRFYLHIGADFWHGGGNCVWVVNGYYNIIDPTP